MATPLIVIAAFALSASLRAADLPRPQGVVTDVAGILSASAKAEAEARIREAEQKSGAEIAIATVPSLEGLSVEEYARKLFNEWGVGNRDKDDGVLILVAPTERKIRIEVGYGLEPVLPDGLAGSIIRTDALLAFRNDDYSGGILAALRRVAAIVEANQIVSPAERRRYEDEAEERPPALLTIPFFGAFIAIGGFAAGVGLRTRTFFPILFGSLFGGLPFLMTLLPFFNATPLLLGPLALGMLVLGYRNGRSETWRQMLRGTTSRGTTAAATDGWVMGDSSSSSSSSSDSSSSSSSSDSFSGGSSGGGGASGSW